MTTYQLTLLDMETLQTTTRKFRFSQDHLSVAEKQLQNDTVIASPGSKGYKIVKIEQL